MTKEITLSEREIQLNEEIGQIYNSGDCKKAVEKSIEFLQEFPNSYIARYQYAVMHGDYSHELDGGSEERQRCREIGNNGMKTLIEDPDFKHWPEAFQFRVRNEYYWFFELHEEQYKLGIERIAFNEAGHYSACVGSSMLALKYLREKNQILAEDWAKKSIDHFYKYEIFAPNWYNINYFGSQSLACLGKYDEALLCYKDMYRKQNAPINENEVTIFITTIDEIKNLRN